ncbi:hypothetical protein DPMN_119976 [Dreissena polymorpha]|uniref:Uncharacterized protein n=1 Tax=Dreissena polymorpha TaxID=45954 RepID=A0A9D4GMM6_DREPO|nr:hypothetical protein DPMN_119976 [Dreissena polymorpha]
MLSTRIPRLPKATITSWFTGVVFQLHPGLAPIDRPRPKPIRNVVTNVNRKGLSSTAIYNFAMDRLQRTHLPTADSVLERRGKQNGNLDVSAARTQIASLLTNLQRLENDHTVPDDLLKSTIQSSP